MRTMHIPSLAGRCDGVLASPRQIASKATLLPPSELPVPAEKFKGNFGEEWATVLKEGRAFNALLLTTFRAHGSGSYHIAYPVVCTALAIALSVLATRVYGACPRVVKEAPGQIVPFGDILDLANKARDTQVGVLSGSDASLAVSSQSGSVV